MPKFYPSWKLKGLLVPGCVAAALFFSHPASAQTYCTPASTLGTPYFFAFTFTSGSGVTNGQNVNNAGSNYTNNTGLGSVGTFYRYFGATSPFAIYNPSNSVSFPSGTVTVFIDWNKDGDFDDANETVYTAAVNMTPVLSNNSFATFYVPNNANAGNYRMRYTYAQSGTPSACGAFTGETEDFLITVPANTAPVLDNSGTPLLNNQLSTYTNSDGFTLDQLLYNNGISYITDAQDQSASQLAPRGIAINGQSATNGTWQYKIGTAGIWTDIGAVSTSNALLLSGNSIASNITAQEIRLRFVPTGIGTPSISFYAWDGTSGTNGTYADATTRGGTTAFSTASETASMNVVAPASVPNFNVYLGSTQVDNILSARLDRTNIQAYDPQVILQSNANFTNLTDMDIDSVNNKIVWTESSATDKIARCNKDGSNVEVLYTFPVAASVPNGIAASPLHLFFTDNGGTGVTKGVYRTSLSGTGLTAITGGASQLATPNQIRDIEYLDGKVYVIARPLSTGDYKIYQIDTTGANPTEVATTAGAPLSLAVANGKLYWTENPGTTNYLITKPISGGTKDTLVTSLTNRLMRDMVVDVPNNKLYYVDYYSSTPTDRYLNVIPTTGGIPVRLLNLPSTYLYIASDRMNASSPLPVSLTGFTGQAANGFNMLYWKTASETSRQTFALQRSKDGKAFETIDFRIGKGTASAYNYADKMPFEGNNYYRLDITEADGIRTYSNTILLNQIKPAHSAIKIYPNPSHDVIHIDGDYGTAIIYNLQGNKLQHVQSSPVMNVSTLASGTYMLVVKDDKGNTIYSQQFVKL